MDKKQENELLKILQLVFDDLIFEKCQNGFSIYAPNFDEALQVLNLLGSMGAYFNTGYELDKGDPLAKARFIITVIDFDRNWQDHSQDSI